MATARLWTRFLLHAAFILLSGASTETRCYWCGPLAEQVHRSRRSAPCGASDHVTVCEPGYNYCAVVATSPPRVESRYCVKVYQDECYPLYCNSTKTWKMTCPCRGDLCNGPNTERENDAFALLPKLVAKTHNARIKKRTANAAPHLIKHEGKNRVISNDKQMHNISSLSSNKMNKITHANLIVTENDANTSSNLSEQPGKQSDQPVNIIVEHYREEDAQITVATIETMQTATVVHNQLIEIEIHVTDPTEKPNSMKGDEQLCTESPITAKSEEAGQNTEPVKDEDPSIATTVKSMLETGAAMNTTEEINAVQNETIKPTETDQQAAVETKSTDEPQAQSPASTTEIMPNDQPMHSMHSVDQMQNDAPLATSTDTVQIKTTEVIKVDEPPTKDTVKASSGTPTAEALQQNGSPPVSAVPVPLTEKPTEPTTTAATTAPTILTTRQPITIQTTTPAPQRKNHSGRITFSYTLILLGCSVFYL